MLRPPDPRRKSTKSHAADERLRLERAIALSPLESQAYTRSTGCLPGTKGGASSSRVCSSRPAGCGGSPRHLLPSTKQGSRPNAACTLMPPSRGRRADATIAIYFFTPLRADALGSPC